MTGRLMRTLIFLVVAAVCAALKPSAASLDAAMKSFRQRLDADVDAALAPGLRQTTELEEDVALLMKQGENQPDTTAEEMPALKALLAQQKRRPARGFEWHDPKRRFGPPPPTIAERMDADTDKALSSSVLDDDVESVDREGPSRSTPPTSAPERAAAWLTRKYYDVYRQVE